MCNRVPKLIRHYVMHSTIFTIIPVELSEGISTYSFVVVCAVVICIVVDLADAMVTDTVDNIVEVDVPLITKLR